MRLSELVVKAAPDSVLEGPEAPQHVQTGPYRAVPDSSLAYPDISRQDVDKSDLPEQTQTAPDRTADRPNGATTGQYSAGMGGNWPDRDVVGVSDCLNLCLRCKLELETEINA